MACKWLVAVDDSIWASYAFNYATAYAKKDHDEIFLLHVTEEVHRSYLGYATPSLIENLRKVQEDKSRKILVHYGNKCIQQGVLKKQNFQLNDFSSNLP